MDTNKRRKPAYKKEDIYKIAFRIVQQSTLNRNLPKIIKDKT